MPQITASAKSRVVCGPVTSRSRPGGFAAAAGTVPSRAFRPPGEPDAAQPMIDWINNASAAELAVEVMAAFDPQVPKRVPYICAFELSDWMFRGYPERRGIILRARPVQEPMLEAIQLLEHSELVYVRLISDSDRYWSATRLGLATLADGKDAVRQRIKDRTGP